jgi:NTE family protein
MMHNTLCVAALGAQEQEVPLLGLNMPIFGLDPYGVLDDAFLWQLRHLGARQEYYDFDALLNAACPEFETIDWSKAHTRVLLGATEIVSGRETVFDSDCNVPEHAKKYTSPSAGNVWRRRLPLSLPAVAASGTLPFVRKAEKVEGESYWDGVYSQNPPIREFLAGVRKENTPEEIWVVRINPQQAAKQPRSTAEIRDRENELIGNLSLNKELDFVLTINDLIKRYGDLEREYKPVTLRTIKMKKETAVTLRVSSKFDRSRTSIDALRQEGRQVARDWLDRWRDKVIGCYPEDAAYT